MHHSLNYRQFLESVYNGKKNRNGQFSLRAFAKQMGVTSGQLTDILKGRKNFSPEKASTIAKNLKLSKTESQFLMLLVQKELTTDPDTLADIDLSLRRLQIEVSKKSISTKDFKVISDWHHVVTLVLSGVPEIELTVDRIATFFEVKVSEAEKILSDLVHLGLLQKSDKNEYAKPQGNFLVEEKGLCLDLQKFHKEMLKKAAQALSEQPPEERYVGTETFAFNAEDLPAARQIINSCLDQLLVLSEQSKKKTHIYHAGVQLFNLGALIK